MSDEDFLRELGKSKYEIPPLLGELWISITTPLASLQSKKEARIAFEKAIRAETKKYGYLFSGDVSLEITLQVHQQDRYESGASPDMDNFLKPLLDSLCGPEGILIDDCQVRSLGINWISWIRNDTQLELIFRYTDTEYVRKKGLAFVQIKGPLCMPVDTSLPVLQQRILFSSIRFGFGMRERLTKLGWDYYAASSVLSVQRRFHRTRLNPFPVKRLDEYKRDLRLLRPAKLAGRSIHWPTWLR